MTRHCRHESIDTPVAQFIKRTSEKISKIDAELSENANNVDASVELARQTCLLIAFEPATEAEIGRMLRTSPVKSFKPPCHSNIAS